MKKKNEFDYDYFLLLFLGLAIAILSLSSCSSFVNLSKKNDKNCYKCYGYLTSNCDFLLKRDSIKIVIKDTIKGDSLSVYNWMKSPCDSLLKNIAKGDTIAKGDIVLTEKKQGKTTVNVKFNKGNGKLTTEIKNDDTFFEKKITAPCFCITTKEDVKNYFKSKALYYWSIWKWWIVGIIISCIALIYFIKK